MRHTLLAVLIQIFFLLILNGCETSNLPEKAPEYFPETTEHKDIVQFSRSEMDEFGIALAQVGPGMLKSYVILPGEIIIPPDNLAHIHPRFPGMVKKVFKHIGDPVTKGETLAIIEGNESLTEYEMKSLINGTLVEKHLSLGEVVSDKEHGFVIADLSQVWAMLKLYQKDLSFIKVGQKVIISSGPNMPSAQGKIAYISPLLDETTRTAEARVILANPKGVWKPGLFINGQINISDVPVKLLIPKTAIQNYENQQVVFVWVAEGIEPRVIQIGRANETSVEILGGVEAGETIVVKGAFTVKAELQKSILGEGHAH